VAGGFESGSEGSDCGRNDCGSIPPQPTSDDATTTSDAYAVDPPSVRSRPGDVLGDAGHEPDSRTGG
jgi:hypothetical protein